MPETLEPPVENQALQTWAQNVYKALGWDYQDVQRNAERNHHSEKNPESVPTGQALSDRLSVTEHQAAVGTLAAHMKTTLSDQSATTAQDLDELQTDLKNGAAGQDADPRLGSMIDKTVARLRATLDEERTAIQALSDEHEVKDTLEKMAALSARFLDKVEAERKLIRFDAAQTSLATVESALHDMRQTRLGIQALQPRTVSELGDEVKKKSEIVNQAATVLRAAGFVGPARGLGAARDALIASASPENDPAWKAVLEEAALGNGSASKLESISGRIEAFCVSLTQEGLENTAHEITDSLTEIRHNATRTILGTLGVLVQLESRAAQKDKFAKREQWTEAHLADKTDALRQQLLGIVRTDDFGTILTRPDDSRVEKMAHEVAGLDHDVYVQIPRRANKKVPRETMESLLASLNLLDELQAAGIKGIEDVASQEVLAAQDLLDGVLNHTSEYETMKKGLSKLGDKIAALGTSNKKKAYYIEERLRLADSVSALEGKYLTTNISQALQQLTALETRYKFLKRGVEHAMELRKQFDDLAKKVNPLFDQIAGLMVEVGRADGLQQTLVESGLLDEAETRYNGALSLQRDEAVTLADNAIDHVELTEAIKLVGEVVNKAEWQVTDLKELKKVMDRSDGKLAAPQQDFLDGLVKDYDEGLARRRKIEKQAVAFDNMISPLLSELEAMTRDKIDVRRLVDLYRGYERVDPETFDRSRLQALLMELSQIKREAKAKNNYEDCMGRLNDAKTSLDVMKGEIIGFREDLVKGLENFTKNCVARISAACEFARDEFSGALTQKHGQDPDIVDEAALKRFLNVVASQFTLDGLGDQVAVIADKNADLNDRKAARERALRIVRPMLSQFSGNKAVQHYLSHPFEMQNDLRIAQSELTQLEVRLLQLAS